MMRTRAEQRGDRWVDQRPQMVHHRRGRGAALHPDRAHLRRCAPRPHRLPVRSRPAGLAHRAPHPDHGSGGAWRALRAANSTGWKSPTRTVLMQVGDGLKVTQIRLGTGAPDPLHALARAGAALARDRGDYVASARASAPRSPSAKACSGCSARPPCRSRSAGC